MKSTKPSILKWSLVAGILIVLNLFFNYATSLVYKQPDYNEYFRQTQVVEPIINKDDCLKVGGQWNEGDIRYGKTVPSPVYPEMAKGYCNPDFTKQQEFAKANKDYNRNIFIILVVLGAISLFFGGFINNEIVSLGLSWGGVLSLIVASARYWSDSDNLVKVLILGVSLVVLIVLAIKKFKD